jgi:hypothetical protein
LNIAIDTPPAIYFGSITIRGGANATAFDNIGFDNFELVVENPEPWTGGLMLAGLALTVAGSRRRRRPGVTE